MAFGDVTRSWPLPALTNAILRRGPFWWVSNLVAVAVGMYEPTSLTVMRNIAGVQNLSAVWGDRFLVQFNGGVASAPPERIAEAATALTRVVSHATIRGVAATGATVTTQHVDGMWSVWAPTMHGGPYACVRTAQPRSYAAVNLALGWNGAHLLTATSANPRMFVLTDPGAGFTTVRTGPLPAADTIIGISLVGDRGYIGFAGATNRLYEVSLT